ncbi:MAG: RNase P subunit p30 family protein [Candidatus Micrarchaeota archaeon]
MGFYDIVQNEKCAVVGQNMGFAQCFTPKQLKIRRGGGLEQNRKAVRSSIDVLLDPATEERLEFDTAVAQLAFDSKIAVVFSLNSVLAARGAAKARLIKNMQSAVAICQKLKCNIAVVSNADEPVELRYPNDLIAFGTLLGMTKLQSKWAVSKALEK